MFPVYLKDVKTDHALISAPCPLEDSGNGRMLVTVSPGLSKGKFKAASRSTAGTTTITSPEELGSIILTDLILTSDKVNGASVTIQFNDDTRQVVIAKAVVTDAPCNLAIPFGGRWQGWQDARLELVTVGVVEATVSCGYIKIPGTHTLPYDEWDAKR